MVLYNFLYPKVLIRRSQVPDELPGDYKVNAGQDIMISVYNIHRSSKVWDRAEEFLPERFDLDGPVPNETNTDFRYGVVFVHVYMYIVVY